MYRNHFVGIGGDSTDPVPIQPIGQYDSLVLGALGVVFGDIGTSHFTR